MNAHPHHTTWARAGRKMSAREIAFALAPKHAKRLLEGGYITRCPVPSHGRGRGDLHPSLSLHDGECGLLVYCHARCDPRDVLAAIRARSVGEPDAPRREGAPKNSLEHKRRQHEKAQWLWSLRQPIKGTIAETYLREARGITCVLPATLGFLPAREDYPPAMIAAFGLTLDDVVAVHLTRLKPDGSGKADVEKPKIVLGSPNGRPIVLAPPNDLLGLAITEGVEDALTAHQLTGLGAWAAGAAGFMPKLADVVAGYIEAVTVCAHRDKAGNDAARALAAALIERGIETVVEGLS